ncbi:MAG: hypothetical protein CMJ25_05450 [Phycisphaerae bacterium]|nr:hypothetical protein [Phycisphaerae bacterium]
MVDQDTESFPWVLLAQELIQEIQITDRPHDQVAATLTLLTTPYLATQGWVVKVAVAVIASSYPLAAAESLPKKTMEE